ncbi:Helix-turn-helix domain-containing protein [Haloechinothrix alba]|uniref:Helix-turn-helix domain-containing protein n=1 Tax=Haloechinothrix alba TaxID=664784 RepID=A0A238X1Z4_9PSEU|nr:helix-turn-helix transcriptional regulator [Haloechinothrix alba]SNR52762.1 Helix-turn-helix domain-containing protein [Haloechinothrix alba]
MSTGPRARSELADFLKTRRAHISPADAGLPVAERRHAPGLRREEVALLTGISATWYTWLEQARAINPSRQVVDALARTMRMSAAEHAYVLHLTGHGFAHSGEGPTRTAPEHVQRLLDALTTSPAYAITHDWSIVAWNQAYERFYPRIAETSPANRNLLWLIFTDPYVHELLADWETDSRRFLTQFRAQAGARVHDPPFAELVQRLREVSEPFRRGWDSHDVDHFTSTERQFHHPEAGPLLLEHHQLSLSDCPDLHVVVYTPSPNSDAAGKLIELTA